MRDMPTPQEKSAFSQRLKEALRRASEPVEGPTQLSLQFNLRHRGDGQVTVQTAHKWLTGRAIPKPDKLHTLSEWLEVDEHWLHYGPAPRRAGERSDTPYPLSTEALTLARKIDALSPRQRDLVSELITTLYGDDA